jgi:uncharacterized membrane protein YgcG
MAGPGISFGKASCPSFDNSYSRTLPYKEGFMLCCCFEFIIMVLGIVVMAIGKVPLSSNRMVQGAPARVIGAIMLLPLIIGMGGEILLGVMLGIDAANKKQELSMQEAQQKLLVPILIIHAVAFGLTACAVIAMAVAYAKPPNQGRDPFYGDQDYLGQGPGGPYGGGPPGGGYGGGGPYGGPGGQFRQG